MREWVHMEYPMESKKNNLPPKLVSHFHRPNKRSSLTKTKHTLCKTQQFPPWQNGAFLSHFAAFRVDFGLFFTVLLLRFRLARVTFTKQSSPSSQNRRQIADPQWLCCNESAPSGCHPFGFGYVGMQPSFEGHGEKQMTTFGEGVFVGTNDAMFGC